MPEHAWSKRTDTAIPDEFSGSPAMPFKFKYGLPVQKSIWYCKTAVHICREKSFLLMKKKDPARVLIDSEAESVLVEPESGRMFQLNATGAFMFRLLENKITDVEIVRLLCQEFDVQEAEAAADLEFFRKTLHSFFGQPCSSGNSSPE